MPEADQEDPKRLWYKTRAASSIVLLLAGLTLLILGLLTLKGSETSILSHLAAVGAGLILTALSAAIWATSDRESPPLARATAQELLVAYDPEKWEALQKRAERILDHYDVTDEELDQLAFDLAAPTGYRDIRESLTLETNGLRRRVELTVEHPRGVRPRFLLLARPPKGERFDAFRLEDPAFRLLSVIETDAILYAVILACFHGSAVDAQALRKFASQLARVLLGGGGSVDRAVLSGMSEGQRDVVIALIVLSEQRRPIIAMRLSAGDPKPEVPGVKALVRHLPNYAPRHRPLPDASLIAWSYFEPIENARPLGGHGCSKIISLVRSGIASLLHGRMLKVPLDRALWSRRYQLSLLVPPYAYVRSSHVTTGGDAGSRLMPEHESGIVYANFFIRYTWPGASAVRVTLNGWRRSMTPRPTLYVRIQERPPGRRAVASLVAAATLVTVVAAASLFPDGGSQTVDIPALGVALPAAIVGVYNLRDVHADVTRSWSARISLGVSFVCSIAGSMLYLAFDSGKLVMTTDKTPLGPRTIYFGDEDAFSFLAVNNWLWLGVVAVAIANALFITMRLSIAVRRYHVALGRV